MKTTTNDTFKLLLTQFTFSDKKNVEAPYTSLSTTIFPDHINLNLTQIACGQLSNGKSLHPDKMCDSLNKEPSWLFNKL